ncbi:MAG: Dam family site-specific DNA-(adenine-N6)-methyltransferase [Pseudomonadota bacterium]
MLRPFLKWAGGKYELLRHIKKFLPKGKRLIEPFAGSACVFLNSNYSQYLIADNNVDLINLYKILQTEGRTFIKECKQLFSSRNNTSEAFYCLRDEFNKSNDPRRRSMLFVYFNRHGFNGLCRYNSKGKFNVPFGKYEKPMLPSERMLTFHKKSQAATFVHSDFATIMAQADQGDVIYCDPPYVPLSKTANFTNYSSDSFTYPEQIKLAELARKCAAKGIHVIISNHDNPQTRKLYHDANKISILVRRNISANGKNRQKVKEILAVFA